MPLSSSRLSALVLLILCTAAFQVQAQDLKIGFVNAARVLEEAPQADAARRKLEEEFSPRDKALIQAQKELRDLEEKLNRDGSVMSETERRKLELDIITRKRDVKRDQDEFREDLNIRRNESFDKLRRRVFEVINEMAKTEKFDLIVSDGIVFASERVDITAKVIERLKQEHQKSPSLN